MTNRVFATPESAEAAFYEAFSKIDPDLMTAVWADSDTALCIHPGGGLLRGKSAIMRSWREIFAGSEPPRIEHRFIEGFATDFLVVRLVEEHIRPRDKPREAANRVLATNVYSRDSGSWRMVEHHASLPLVDRSNDSAGNEPRLH